MMHNCIGDALDPTHDCWCEIGRNHEARDHRAEMRARRDAERTRLDAER